MVNWPTLRSSSNLGLILDERRRLGFLAHQFLSIIKRELVLNEIGRQVVLLLRATSQQAASFDLLADLYF